MTLEERILSAAVALFADAHKHWAAEDETTRSYYKLQATRALQAACPELFKTRLTKKVSIRLDNS